MRTFKHEVLCPGPCGQLKAVDDLKTNLARVTCPEIGNLIALPPEWLPERWDPAHPSFVILQRRKAVPVTGRLFQLLSAIQHLW